MQSGFSNTNQSVCQISAPVFSSSIQLPDKPVNHCGSFLGIVSECHHMFKIYALLEKVSRTSSTVLILGESGTGKELVAKALHKLSGRSGRMVPVNCGAIPEDILESELFGHEKGAFTGAISNKIGRFQFADGGTIFLDEIGEMSPKLQVKLLRVLQERKIEPVGSTRCIDVDVRVVAATNKDLREEVKAGRFREDLYYRLQVVPIQLPPLRLRSGDSVILARHFLSRACAEIGKETLQLSQDVERKFQSYTWPGNVRELENLIERLAILVDSDRVELRDLPEYMHEQATLTERTSVLAHIPEEGVDFNDLVDQFEKGLINAALERTDWNKKAAAKLLRLNRTTLVEKIKKKGMEVREEVTAPGCERPF
ncbi:MAG: RNA polymerase subunit sigma-54 [Proteobacteria bacterium]|nr:MAG: RNA polymerase subunit sigma-54 [Pseudomonadota bacterium]